MPGTFWSDWFIYFREGSAAVAGGGGKRERGGGREREGKTGWKNMEIVFSEVSPQLLGDSLPHFIIRSTRRSQARQE